MIYQLTFFQALALLFAFLIISLNAADDVQYSHFFKTKHTQKPEEVKTKKSITNDSNAFLNFRSKNRPINLNREQQIQMEIGIGHNNHEKLVPLIDQLNKHEEHANRVMIVGMLLRKDDHKHGQPLMMWTHQQRLRAQETQLQMNKIQSEGHIENDVKQQQISNFLRGLYAIRRKFKIYRCGETKTVLEQYRPRSSSKDGARQRFFKKTQV